MNIPTWLLFTLFTFALSTPFYYFIYKSRDESGERPMDRAFRQLMWVPGIVAYGFLVLSGRGFSEIHLGLGENPWLLLAGLLAPIAMEIILIVAAIRLSLGLLDPNVYRVQDGWILLSKEIRMVLGTGRQAPLKFWLNLTGTLGIAAAFMLIFSLAEEIGWRGFLQNELIDTFSLTWGMVLGGLIWGAWHIPPILAGMKFSENPRLGAYVFMPIYTISLGIVAGWLFWLSGSIWVPAIFNASARVSGRVSEIALGEAGSSRRVRIVWLWLWAVLAGLCLTLWWASY